MSFPSNIATEAQLEVDTLVTQVASEDISVSTEALLQLEELLRNPSRNVLLTGRVNELIKSIILQCDEILGHSDKPDAVWAEVFLLYQNLCIFITSLFEYAHLSKEVTFDSLRDMIINLMLLLNDEFLKRIKFDLIRPILFQLLKRGNRTICVDALVTSLYGAVDNTQSVQITEFVIKCLSMFDQISSRVDQKVDLSWMFLKIHQFFMHYPMRYWKDQPDDTPMRTLQTLMRTVVKQFGSGVLDHIDRIPKTSEVVSYLKIAVAALPHA